MPALAEYSNVYETALRVLADKGYQLWFDEEIDMFRAEKDGWDFAADTPLSLLGCIALFERKAPAAYSEYWWREESEGLYFNLPTEPPQPFTPIYRK